jgi:hypothetical protein
LEWACPMRSMNITMSVLSLLLSTVITSNTVSAEEILADTPPSPRVSRLSQLVRRSPQLFLPAQLLIGKDNTLILQAPPGSQVTLYLSKETAGFSAPNGTPLRIGKTHETLTATVPNTGQSTGTVSFTVPIPNEPTLEGTELYLEAFIWKADDYTDAHVAQIVDSTGRRTDGNAITIRKVEKAVHLPLVMPSVPGMPANMMQSLSTMSDAYSDERKKELLDTTGSFTRDSDRTILRDKNSFLQLPGAGVPSSP